MTDAPQPGSQPPPTPPAQAPDPNAPEWMYMANGQQVGPVSKPQLEAMVTAGQLGIDTPVWRNGMAAWAPIGSLSDPNYRPPADRRKFKNATQNCIAMFAIGAIGMVGMIAGLLAELRDEPRQAGLSIVGIIAGVFAAIYLPLRWKLIMQQSPTVRTLGLIGGFLLIAVLIVSALSLVLWLAAGAA